MESMYRDSYRRFKELFDEYKRFKWDFIGLDKCGRYMNAIEDMFIILRRPGVAEAIEKQIIYDSWFTFDGKAALQHKLFGTFRNENVVESLHANLYRDYLSLKYRKRKCLEFKQCLSQIPKAPISLTKKVYGRKTKRNVSINAPKFDLNNIYKLRKFVVIDTEATDLGKIVELAAIRFVDWKPVEYFSTLINPKVFIGHHSIRIHNISNEMVSRSPEFSEVMESFRSFMSKSSIYGHIVVVGHGVEGDLSILAKNGCRLHDVESIDTYSLSLELFKGSHKLTCLCEENGIFSDNPHRALSDCLATGLLFNKMAGIL
ncbi:MAG: 3'-5' exonuclease [Clostridiales bacterium]|jgi:DNA polymerase III epsilon subunit-like protein|nr:3'-5' exonuclease [Clostridiales bacterium]